MEYKKLNLIDGTDEELKTFISLVKDALEFREVGLSNYVDVATMSKLISLGVISANVCYESGAVCGIQVFEIASFWFDVKTKYKNLRIQFLKNSTPEKHVKFMQWGAAQQKNDGVKLICSIDAKDQLFNIVEHFDLKTFGVVKSI